MQAQRRTFCVHTLGCKVNQYESELVRETLIAAGLAEAPAGAAADLCIVNSCTVTENADRESRYWLRLFRRRYPRAQLVLTGCYAQVARRTLATSFPDVLIVPNRQKGALARLAGIAAPRSTREMVTGLGSRDKAFVKIQDGCDNFCSYCKVPYVRPHLSSKPAAMVIEEVRRLVDGGYREIILTGICLGAWGKTTARGPSDGRLVDLLGRLDELPGDFRMRLSSIEPKHITAKLIRFLAASRRFCRHLHIPLQSGDDAVLRRMHRPYTGRTYAAIIRRVRAAIKDVAITTDLLLGFPGETDSEFRHTVRLVRQIRPLRAHIFTFSRRAGTAAYGMAGEIQPAVLKERYARVAAAVADTSYAYRQKFAGALVPVLVEARRDPASGDLCGYTDTYIRVLLRGPDTIMKKIVPVRITAVDRERTIGEYVDA